MRAGKELYRLIFRDPLVIQIRAVPSTEIVQGITVVCKSDLSRRAGKRVNRYRTGGWRAWRSRAICYANLEDVGRPIRHGSLDTLSSIRGKRHQRNRG